MCVLPICTSLEVVSHYDLSVLSMFVMGFQKKSLDRDWVGGVSSIQFDFFLNRSKIVISILIFWGSISCVFCLYVHC